MTNQTILTFIDFLAYALQTLILIRVIISWVAPTSTNPAVRFVQEATDPILKPLQRILPSMAGIDFSPILAFVGIQVLQNVLRSALG